MVALLNEGELHHLHKQETVDVAPVAYALFALTV